MLPTAPQVIPCPPILITEGGLSALTGLEKGQWHLPRQFRRWFLSYLPRFLSPGFSPPVSLPRFSPPVASMASLSLLPSSATSSLRKSYIISPFSRKAISQSVLLAQRLGSELAGDSLPGVSPLTFRDQTLLIEQEALLS